MILSQALNRDGGWGEKEKKKKKEAWSKWIKATYIPGNELFPLYQKGKKDKEVKNVIICCRKNYMAISVSQAYIQGTNQNSDTLTDFL